MYIISVTLCIRKRGENISRRDRNEDNAVNRGNREREREREREKKKKTEVHGDRK